MTIMIDYGFLQFTPPSAPLGHRSGYLRDMSQNTLGTLLRLTTFGESHGPAIGGVLDGMPAGLDLDLEAVQHQLGRRRPGQSDLTSPRKEKDELEILSGLFEGKTTGAPIAFIIRNTDQKPKDYSHIKDVFRPSHADYVFEQKYGLRDYRGGGRSSARVTAPIVAGGAMAAQLLVNEGVRISAYVQRVGEVESLTAADQLDMDQVDAHPTRCPDPNVQGYMESAIRQAQQDGDTLGGAIQCVASDVPVGWGAPVFQKLHAQLAQVMMGINAAKAFEMGSGIQGTYRKGSEENDVFQHSDGRIRTITNHSGGIQGGISNGEPVQFKVHFKPIATLMQDQSSVDKEGQSVTIEGKGRHDPCVVPRAVPIVEALAALVLADAMLQSRTDKMG